MSRLKRNTDPGCLLSTFSFATTNCSPSTNMPRGPTSPPLFERTKASGLFEGSRSPSRNAPDTASKRLTVLSAASPIYKTSALKALRILNAPASASTEQSTSNRALTIE
ncbi:hypothetical protein D9M71_607930 [compost metagenome]